MRRPTQEEAKNMSLETAGNVLGNNIYEASAIYEIMEHAGRVRGNGHHIRQKLVEMAESLLKERWID